MNTAAPKTKSNQQPESAGADSYVMLRNMTTTEGEPIEDILHRVAKHMAGLQEKAIIHLRVIRTDEAGTKKVYSLHMTPSGSAVRADVMVAPTLTLITTAKALRQMLSGSYSPVQAYLDGRLHRHGDVALAKRVALHLAESGSNVSVCPLLDAEQWHSDGRGYGSLTVSGFNFTPGGVASLIYDWGGGRFRKNVIADDRGRFTVTELGIPCGDFPGQPGVGVIVSVFDLASGQSLITGDQSYATPC